MVEILKLATYNDKPITAEKKSGISSGISHKEMQELGRKLKEFSLISSTNNGLYIPEKYNIYHRK